MSKIERAKVDVGVRRLEQLLRAYGIPPAVALGFVGQENREAIVPCHEKTQIWPQPRDDVPRE